MFVRLLPIASDERPSLISACALGEFVSGDLDEVAVCVVDEVAGGEDLGLVDGLDVVVDVVVVDFAVDALLDDFVGVGFDGFVGDFWRGVRRGMWSGWRGYD